MPAGRAAELQNLPIAQQFAQRPVKGLVVGQAAASIGSAGLYAIRTCKRQSVHVLSLRDKTRVAI
jgi:hypothetical protein